VKYSPTAAEKKNDMETRLVNVEEMLTGMYGLLKSMESKWTTMIAE